MIVRAPAKINLTLEILNRQDDGYHRLRSVMLPIALEDEIGIEPAERFSFACEPAALTGDNLVVRALAAAGMEGAPLAVELHKRIPVGAGLGGGSSDAAAMLRAAIDGALGTAGAHDWIAVARALGSDVPFFLTGTGALVEETGERVTALGALPPWWVVVLAPDVHVDTGDAYRRLAAARAQTPPPSRPRAGSASLRALEAVQRGDYAAAIAAATNDFEPLIAAAYPPVAAALRALQAAHAPHAMLSGSGGATFALCEREADARELAAAVELPERARLFVVPLAYAVDWRVLRQAQDRR
ncbi:MAG: 4-(cytidine 5'-diphospho)-2-C-methyl-D-erythritol kinase [Candidatus Lustribacter sp.]